MASKSSSSGTTKKSNVAAEKSSVCIGCGKAVPNPREDNHLGDELICDSCRQEMVSSLEGAWKRQSAFLDSALN